MDRYKLIDNVGVYFVTFTVVDWLPVFVDKSPISILIDSMKYCIENKGLRVNAFVIMPNHLHAVVFNTEFESASLHQTLTDFRKFTGQALADYVNNRFSKAISSILQQEKLEDRKRRFWQSGWHAEGIESEKFLVQKVNYFHDNPCRKGLVRLPQDWRYSSAAFWLEGESVDLPIASLEWGNLLTCVRRRPAVRCVLGLETGTNKRGGTNTDDKKARRGVPAGLQSTLFSSLFATLFQ